VTPCADRSTLAGRGREKLVKLAGDRLETAWREADLPMVPRWFLPVAKDMTPYVPPEVFAAAGE
jgi:hypothetical protein